MDKLPHTRSFLCYSCVSVMLHFYQLQFFCAKIMDVPNNLTVYQLAVKGFAAKTTVSFTHSSPNSPTSIEEKRCSINGFVLAYLGLHIILKRNLMFLFTLVRIISLGYSSLFKYAESTLTSTIRFSIGLYFDPLLQTDKSGLTCLLCLGVWMLITDVTLVANCFIKA